MTNLPTYGLGKTIERYAALAKWYELYLEDISKAYPGDRDYPGVLARQALAERHKLLNETTQTSPA